MFIDGYSTHIPLLSWAVTNTDGPILELGAGLYSTPMLSLLKNQRRLVSFESHNPLIDYLKSLFNHELYYSENWDDENFISVTESEQWGVILVDHAPAEQRVKDIKRLRDKATLIVIHDTESEDYGYAETIASFKYEYTYKKLLPWTTMVSDVFEMRKE